MTDHIKVLEGLMDTIMYSQWGTEEQHKTLCHAIQVLKRLEGDGIAEIARKHFGVAKVNPKTDIYKDKIMADVCGKTLNWYMTHGLAQALQDYLKGK